MSATTETTGQPGPFGFAKMAGSSIAGRDAAAWVTDFLNAAYYRRAGRRARRRRPPLRLRRPDHLLVPRRTRRAGCASPTCRRSTARSAPSASARGGAALSREALERGAAKLIGDWFPAAYADDARRAWGIAFETVAERDAVRPVAPAGAGQARRADRGERAAGGAGLAHLRAGRDAVGRGRHRRADAARRPGRTTRARSAASRRCGPAGCAGQTFEIEVAANTRSALPVFTRGYVTITSLVTPDDPVALRDWFEALEDGMARYGKDEPPVLPEGAEPLVGFDLTTHRGHFMGSGHNRLTLYTHEGKAWVQGRRHVGPDAVAPRQGLPAARAARPSTRSGARRRPALSMLHQLARAICSMSDAVVIGAGPNGLAAAIRLAEAGRSVLLLEAADAPGGAVRTEELTLPGFQPRHVLLGLPGGGGLAGVRADAAGRRTGWSGCTRPRPTRTRCPAASAKLLYRGLDETAASLGGRDGEQLGAVRAPVPGQLRRRARDDAHRLPAARRPAEAARRRRPAAAAGLHADAARLAPSGSASACSTTAARRPGSTAPRCTATRRRTAPARGSRRST